MKLDRVRVENVLKEGGQRAYFLRCLSQNHKPSLQLTLLSSLTLNLPKYTNDGASNGKEHGKLDGNWGLSPKPLN